MGRRFVLSTCLAVAVLVAPLYVGAERARMPEARSFAVWEDDAEHRIIGIVEAVPGTEEWVGFVVRCVKATGTLEGSMAFGFFPTGKRVQAAVRAPSGRVERFGPVVVGGRGSGFHSPEVTGRSDVLRLMNAAMVNGALISNGHNSVWNRVGRTRNDEARKALMGCSRG